MKSLAVHYMNKYPSCRVSFDDTKLDVISKDGEHLIAMRKNGAGQVVDVSEELGLSERHDLSEIPRDCRFMKLGKDSKISKDEMHDERKPHAEKLVGKHGKVLSCAELKSIYGTNEKGEFSFEVVKKAIDKKAE